jgi:hypothetical protein
MNARDMLECFSGKPFKPSLMFAGKPGAYPSWSKHLKGVPLYGRRLALPKNIRLG